MHGWSDYQRARERFLRERATEARAASSDRAVAAVADGATATADPPPARAVVE
ncbi:MAG TPA: hypothetical protein VK904_08835 [Miltoncostaeaceae bacterium]|nr:hypothetical protein [Miltoncostaeaceae bacterium]